MMASHTKIVGTVFILLAFACSSKRSTNPDAGMGPDTPGALADTPVAKDVPAKDVAPAPDLSPDSAPFLADPGSGVITGLQIQETDLYWIGGYHRIVKAASDGTAATTLYTAPGKNTGYVAIEGIALDDSNVYFTYAGDGDYANRGVYKLPLAGASTPIKLTSTQNPNVTIPDAIAVSGADIYYSESSAILHVKTSGGTVTTMVQDRGNPNDSRLVIKQGYLYFTMLVGSSGRDDVYRLPLGAATSVPMDAGSADGGESPMAPEKVSLVPGNYSIQLGQRLDQGFLYWGVFNTVYRTDGNSPAAEVFTAGSSLQPTETGLGGCLLPYDGIMYWSRAGRLFKQTVGVAGNGTAFANGGTGDMVADANFLYLASGATITRLAH